jgi:uncharacterized protein (UPF0335 family)
VTGDNTGVAADRLRSIIERIERMNEEIKGLQEDRREIFTEAKSAGYDAKALRAIIRRRAQDAQDRKEHEETVDLYLQALGWLDD